MILGVELFRGERSRAERRGEEQSGSGRNREDRRGEEKRGEEREITTNFSLENPLILKCKKPILSDVLLKL